MGIAKVLVNQSANRKQCLSIVSVAGTILIFLITAEGVSYAQDAVAARLLDQADQLMSRGDVTGTLQIYQDFASRFPRDERAPVALLRLAEGRWSTGDLVGAIAAIEQLRERYSRSPSAAGSWVLEGEMQWKNAMSVDDLQTAYTTFGNVSVQFGALEYPDPIWRRRAGSARGRLSLLLGNLDLAAGEFLSVIEDEPSASGTADGQIALAEVLTYRREWSAAAEILQRVIDRGAVDELDRSMAGSDVLARRRLSLLHRTVFRPALRRSPWMLVRRLEVPGRGLSNPVGLAVGPDGQMVVTDDRADLALTFGSDGALLATTVVDRGGFPWTSNEGELYVLDRRVVQRPFGDTGPITFSVPNDGQLRNLENLRAGARGVFGEWFILDTRRRQVVRFDRQRRYSETLVGRDSDSEIVDLALDRRGRLYSLDRRQNRVIRFSLNGSVEGVVASGEWSRPEALTVDDLGNLYVLDRDEKTIDLFDPDGKLLLTYGPQLPDGTLLREPRDLAVDGFGRLYVADRDLDAVFILE